MASYVELPPLKDGTQRIKITVEDGYSETTGKRIRHTKTVRMKSMSQRAINKAITDFEIEVAKKEDERNIENITFEQFVKRWLDIYVSTLAVRTIETNKSALKGGVMDYFKDMKMNKIKTFHVVEFFSKQVKENKKSLSNKHTTLRSIFSKAVLWEVIESNPMDGVKKIKATKRRNEVDYYNEDQLKHLFKVLENVYPKHRLQIKMAALIGLRIGELAGITLDNINYNDETILIEKTLQYDSEAKKLVLVPTKTKENRTVGIPSELVPEIKKFAKEQNKLKLRNGNVWNPFINDDGDPINFLFTREDGYPTHPKVISGEWRKMIKKYKLPQMPFHGFRHTCASYMVSQGVNFKIIQEQLGHSDIRMTLDRYSHLSDESKKEAINVFNNIL